MGFIFFLQTLKLTFTNLFVDSTDEESSEPGPLSSKPSERSKILGTKEFTLDDNFLDTYLVDVLQWWHGQRPPKGVEVKLSRRCLYVLFFRVLGELNG